MPGGATGGDATEAPLRADAAEAPLRVDAIEAPLRVDALEAAHRALRHRDLSTADLEQRLASRGFDDRERAEALATLHRTGLLDDRRFADSRGAALAGRGAGDALIRHDLERAGVDAELVEDAVASLEPECDRANLVVERRGLGPRTIRYLRSKGFSDETVAAVAAAIAPGSRDELG